MRFLLKMLMKILQVRVFLLQVIKMSINSLLISSDICLPLIKYSECFLFLETWAKPVNLALPIIFVKISANMWIISLANSWRFSPKTSKIKLWLSTKWTCLCTSICGALINIPLDNLHIRYTLWKVITYICTCCFI